MSDIILPSKLVQERITVRFDFKDELAWGETIVGQDVVVTTVVGVDNAPDLLYQVASALGSIVKQQIWQGLPGVLYKLECTVTGSTGKIYTKWAHLAILPDNARNPPIFATLFTSRPYPVDVLDAIDAGGPGLVFGNLLGIPLLESVDTVGSIVSGNLEVILVQYPTVPEGVDLVGTIISGDLFVSLKSFSTTEAVDTTGIIVSGDLVVILITYTVPAEGVDTVATLVSGSLI